MTLAQPFNYNPDVLTCIANLSNDEVFTPPELANQMLDDLAAAWADAHNGADIWRDSSVTFLDPFTKSGVFLREVTRRLVAGLEDEIPDLADRVDHILTKQVFGIAITNLTALLARRSVYCSKFANGKYSVASSFETDAGNIWFERTEHTWEKRKRVERVHPTSGAIEKVEVEATGRCKFCGAQESAFDRGDQLETHAYDFIHTDDIKARIGELFGADMHFDVIIGNPPYQMTGASGGSSDASIYHLFVEQAQQLEPHFLTMVMPSRWMAGGRGMGEFREQMLSEGHLRSLVDYPDSKEVFPGIELKGGVCYFLWDRQWNGPCEVASIRGGERQQSLRDLDEFDVFVRDERAVDILKKVLTRNDPSIAEILTNREPFKFESNFTGFRDVSAPGDIPFFHIRDGKRGIGFISRDAIEKNVHLIDTAKVLVTKGYGAGETIPHQILGIPQVAASPSACTGSYMFFYLDSESEATSLSSYLSTRFFRFLVSLRKITQDAFRSVYTWVPMQTWDRTWTDAELYEKYGLTDDEIAFIESQIKPMELGLDLD